MSPRLPLLALLTSAVLHTSAIPPSTDIFAGDTPLVFTLDAPLQQLFDRGLDNEEYAVDGTFAVQGGSPVPVRVSVRGNTSRRESECTFPKLKLKFAHGEGPDGQDSLKLGTHCGEHAGEDISGKFGRLANDLAPWREVTVYRVLEALHVPALRARTARGTYTDTSSGGTIVPSPITRNALILEDDDDALKRAGGGAPIEAEQFTTARDLLAPPDAARVAFAEAAIGNFDWCLKFSDSDRYRCDARRKLWNLIAGRRDSTGVLLMKDFDLAGPVVARHNWFDTVYDTRFVQSGSAIDAEVVAQVQRTRSLFPRDVLDAARREFLDRRGAAYDTVARAAVDPRGRALARQYLDAFYRAIESDQAFYRPVVTAPGAHVYTDAGATREVCAAGDEIPPGTPVAELQRSGEMAEVRLLDVMWKWAPPTECKAVHAQPVWITAAVIGANYPER